MPNASTRRARGCVINEATLEPATFSKNLFTDFHQPVQKMFRVVNSAIFLCFFVVSFFKSNFFSRSCQVHHNSDHTRVPGIGQLMGRNLSSGHVKTHSVDEPQSGKRCSAKWSKNSLTP